MATLQGVGDSAGVTENDLVDLHRLAGDLLGRAADGAAIRVGHTVPHPVDERGRTVMALHGGPSDGAAAGEQPEHDTALGRPGVPATVTPASSDIGVSQQNNEVPPQDGSGPAEGPTVADVMITRPKTLPSDASVGDVRAVFDDDHVVMVLLTRDGVLLGALVRDDLGDDVAPTAPALPLSRTRGRTVAPTDSATAVHLWLLEHGQRRLAVTDAQGSLLGLVCLKRRRTGFCSDRGVEIRAHASRLATDLDSHE